MRSDVDWSGSGCSSEVVSVTPRRNGSLLLFKICNITTSRKIASTNEQNNNYNNNNVCVIKLQ